jgi:putative phosphoribosyl transferase
MEREIKVPLADGSLQGHLSALAHPRAWIVFVHGSGSSGRSPRNRMIAKQLNGLGYSTFLFDLLTPEEDEIAENRFKIPLLTRRLTEATGWLERDPAYHREPMIFFGASTGAAAALSAAALAYRRFPLIAVVSRGGRPDLAREEDLRRVTVPVLLLVGSLDHDVVDMNFKAQRSLPRSELQLIPGATHLFEEPGALDQVVYETSDWLDRFLPSSSLEGVL